MVYKRVSKIIFAAILAVTVFSGCGNRQEEGIDKTETETTTQKSTGFHTGCYAGSGRGNKISVHHFGWKNERLQKCCDSG